MMLSGEQSEGEGSAPCEGFMVTRPQPTAAHSGPQRPLGPGRHSPVKR